MLKKSMANRMSEQLNVNEGDVARYRNLSTFASNAGTDDDNAGCSSGSFYMQDELEAEEIIESDFDIANASSSSENAAVEPLLKNNIIQWVLRNKVPNNQVDDLLSTLIASGIKNLPRTTRTLFGTSYSRIEIATMAPDEYHHFGIENYFKTHQLNFLSKENIIVIDVGVDGLQLFKSSRRVLWPILGAFSNFTTEMPFLIGCFSGFKKPNSANEFLKAFCEEVNYLQTNGCQIGSSEIRKPFKVRLFTYDSPARAFITGVQYHTGTNSCPKCAQQGIYLNHRVVFEAVTGNERSDETLKERRDLAHHSLGFQQKNSNVLEEIGIGMVSQFS